MKKRILSFVLSVLMVVSLMPTVAWADDSITYIERSWNGTEIVEEAKTITDYTAVTEEYVEEYEGFLYLESGYYVVCEDVETTGIYVELMEEDPIYLILCDGMTISANVDGFGIPAVQVGEGSSLVICGQSGDTGKLIASGDGGAAGIGSGIDESGGDIVICGGTIVAKGGKDGGAGIGNGSGIDLSGGSVTVNGGIVKATGGEGAAGIGGGNGSTAGTLTINGGSVTARGGEGAPGIGDGLGTGDAGTVTVNGGSVTRINGFCEELEYYEWDDVNNTMVKKTIDEYEFVTDETEVLDGGYYVVQGDVETGCIDVSGTEDNPTYLILCDGATLSARAQENTAMSGIHVVEGKALVVCAQSGNTGKLNAYGDSSASGIGGGMLEGCGLITINGGEISAVGGGGKMMDVSEGFGFCGGGAGIGGGYSNTSNDTVTVNGGIVTAQGNELGAGIGGGGYGKGGAVTINGGTVTAIGSQYGAGIGGGSFSDGGVLTVNGGTVTAESEDGVGIGAGDSGLNAGTLTVAGSHEVWSGSSESSVIVVTLTGSTPPSGSYVKITEKLQRIPTITTTPSASAIVCGQALSASSLTGGAADTEGTFAWKDGTIIPSLSDSESTEYDVVFTPTDTTNYTTVELKVKVKVNKASQSEVTVTMSGYTYGETPSTPGLSGTVEENPAVTYYYNDSNSFTGATEWKNITSTTLDAGTYYMFATLSETSGFSSFTTSGTSFAVAKVGSTCTAPAAITGLEYNSTNQTLIVAGSTEDGTLKYSLTGTDDYSESLPFGRDAGEYRVYYKVFGDTNHNDSSASYITVSIAKTDWIITTEPEAKTGLVYNALGQELVTPGSCSGTMKYRLETADVFSEDIPEGTDAGTYNVFYKVEADLNHNEFVCEAPISVSIAKADWTVTSPTGNSLSYTGTVQALVTAGIVKDVQGNVCANMLYSLTGNSADFSTTLPTAKEVGEYTIYYKVAGNDNYNEYAASTVTASIGKVDRTDIPSVIMNGYTYDTSEDVPAPSLDATPEENPEVVFYYNTENSYTGATEWKDITSTTLDAGTYYMFATLSETASYRSCTTAGTAFVIAKAESSCTAPVAKIGLKYNSINQTLITAGSTEDGTLKYSLTGTDDYSESLPFGRDAGEYRVYYKVFGDMNHNDSTAAYVTVTIDKTDWIITTEPEAKTGLVYNALAQELVSAGTAGGDGVIKYSLTTDGTFTADIPEGTDAGTYNVFYKVEADLNHNEFVCEEPISVSIAKADWTVTSPTGNSLSYTGTDQALVTAGTVKDVQGNLCENTMLYSLTGEAADFSTTLPTAKEVGEYTIYYKVAENDNYNEFAPSTVKASIGKTDRTDIPSVIMNGYTFDTTETLPAPSLDATPEENPTVTYYYNDTDSFDEATEWKDITSTTLDAGTYYMFATLSETASYRSCTTAGTAFVVAKAESSCTAPVAKIGLKYNSINQTLITAGSTEDGTLKYSLTGTDDYSESLPLGRDAGEYRVYYKVFGDMNHNDSTAAYVTVTIDKTDWIITTEPAAKTGLVYNALAQELVSAGTAGGDGVIKYSLTTDGTFTADIPEGTDAGTYSVFYKVEEDTNHNEYLCEAPVSVSITKADWNVTSPTGNSLSYTGTDQALVTAGTVKDVQGNLCENTMLYSLTGEAADFSTTIPTAKEVGEYTIYYKVAGNDNYNEYVASTVTASIGKVDRTDIPSVIMNGYTFDTTETLPAPSLDATPEENPTVTYYYNDTDSFDEATEWKDITSTTLDAGTYYMFATLSETASYRSCTTAGTAFVIAKAESSCTAPVAKNGLKYNSINQTLITAGSTEDGTLKYSLTGTDDYSESLPFGRDAGEYRVYYKVFGDMNHNDSTAAYVTVTIDKTDWIITTEPEAKTGLVYNALAQELVSPGTAGGDGVIKYSLTTDGTFTADIPEGTDAGTYNVFYKVEADLNHNEFVCEAPISVSIAKADWTVTSPTGNSLSYTGTDQALVTAGSVKDVQGNLCENTMLYSLTGEAADFSTTLPTAKEVGEYTIYYKVAGNDNYNEYAASTVTASIGKTDRTDIPSVIMDGYTYDTSEDVPTPSLDATPEENPEVVFYYNTENSYTGATEWKDITSTTLNAGTYYMFAELGITESYAACKTEIISFSIEKAESTCIAPAAIPDLKYNGWDLWLVSEGSTEDGTLVYSLTGNDDDYSESRPSGKNAGNYTVYYKVLGDANHKDSEPASVNVTIAKADRIVTAPVAEKDLVYNALGQELVSAGTAGDGVIKYSLTADGTFTADIPEGTDAGTYNVFYKVEADLNHNEFVCEEPISVSITKADWTVTSPTGNSLSYTGTDRALVTAGSVKDVQGNLCENTMLYSLTGEAADFSTTIPTAKEVGEYTIYYKVSENDNYNEFAPSTVSAEIGKSERTDIPSVIMDGYTYKTSDELPAPSLSEEVSEEPEVVYFYNSDNSFTGAKEWKDITSVTLNAGTYYMFATIGETESYKAVTTPGTAFVIDKAVYTGQTEIPVSLNFYNEFKPKEIGKAGLFADDAGSVTFEFKKSEITGEPGFASQSQNDDSFLINFNKMEEFVENSVCTLTYTVSSDNYVTYDVTVKVTRNSCSHPADRIVTEHKILPGCETTGLDCRRCSVCDMIIEDDIPVAELGHDFDEDAVCTRCGLVLIEDAPGFVISADKVVYDGEAKTPVIRVTFDGEVLVKGTDYTESYSPATEPGDYNAVITGLGNYRGTLNCTWTIVPPEQGLWCAEIEDYVYTGKAIKPEVEVFCDGRLLTNGKDYKLSYGKNNTKAAKKDAVNKKNVSIAPSVIITGKGNYKGKITKTFTILPRDLSEAEVDDVFVASTGKNIKLAATVKVDGRKLKAGTDYFFSTEEDGSDEIKTVKDAGEYELYVIGRGNYEGSVSFTCTVTSYVPASKVSISKISARKYKGGEPIEPDVRITYKKRDVTDKFNITYENNTEVGTATVIVTAKEIHVDESGAVTQALSADDGAIVSDDPVVEKEYFFVGSKKTTFKITGKSISGIKLGEGVKLENCVYTGEAIEPDLGYFYLSGEALSEGSDYTVSYSNNVKVGTATVTVTGIGSYVGKKKFTFKITPYNVEDDTAGAIEIGDGTSASVAYEKGGAQYKPVVTMNGTELALNKDYTIKYSNNKAVADESGEKVPTATISFKGNFKGKRSVGYSITEKDIEECTMTAADKVAGTKPNGWKQTSFTITDTNGKKLSAKTDYDSKAATYYYDEDCTREITEETLAPETVVYVKVDGCNNYTGSIVGSYRISKINIKGAKVKIAAKEYTGEEITLDADDIIVTIGSGKNRTVLNLNGEYEIVPGSYKNNINKGKASVVIRGTGDYCGTRTVKFTIASRGFTWWRDLLSIF